MTKDGRKKTKENTTANIRNETAQHPIKRKIYKHETRWREEVMKTTKDERKVRQVNT